MMYNWNLISDGLPKPKEKFKNGSWFHGNFWTYYPDRLKNHQIENSALFTCRGRNPRWSASPLNDDGNPKIIPTHWAKMLEPPPEPEKNVADVN